MGFFNRKINLDADALTPISKTSFGKKLIRTNGMLAAGVASLPGTFVGGMAGETADDINDIYYKGKDNPYNSSYNAAGFVAGGIAGILVGGFYGRKATKMLLDSKWAPKSEKFKDFMMKDV